MTSLFDIEKENESQTIITRYVKKLHEKTNEM